MALREEVTLARVHAARDRLSPHLTVTPVVSLQVREETVHLKCENLHPIGSFKLRGAGNALLEAPPERIASGVVTASAGNMAQGVAWWARKLGVPCTAVVPDTAPDAKLIPFEALGGRVLRVPYQEWWVTLERRGHPDAQGYFVHPVADPAVVAGNGTLALELLEQVPDLHTVLVPFGGGGLSSGIGATFHAMGRKVRVIGCEVETAAPLRASLAAGRPMQVDRTPSWVDGIGGSGMLEEMWPLVREVVPEAAVSSLAEVAHAVRVLAGEARLVAEGAGAASLAPVLAGRVDPAGIVCVVSGGNINPEILASILTGGTPM